MERVRRFFWRIVPFVPLILFLMGIMLLINYYNSLRPANNIIDTVGTVTGYKNGRGGRTAILTFKNQGRNYSTRCSDQYVVGEKFIVEYDADAPEKNRVREDKPVFLDEEKTGSAVGIVTVYNPDYFKSISFIYFIDGEKYEHSYKPEKNWKLKYPDLKEGKKYRVQYWEDNPWRSVILLDEPTTEPLLPGW